jgi:hypothetical protein
MNLGAINLTKLSGRPAQVARTLALAPGSPLVARVLAAPPQGGRGTIALAGTTVQARLPKGLQAGQTLKLEVVRVEQDQLTVRIRPAGATVSADPAALAQAAGGLAVAGDGELLRAALALAGQQPLWLPDGGAASVQVQPDDAAAGRRGDAGVAAFVLHSPSLGPIEVRIALSPGGVQAGVVTSPGHATELAEAELPALADRLAAATGGPAAVAVSQRPATTPAPAPPAGRVDVQA